MKKLWLLFAISGIVLSFSSCKKDKVDAPSSLTGTSWVSTVVEGDYSYTDTLVFGESEVSSLYADSDGDSDSYSGTYTYDAPTVTLKLDGSTLIGTVKGNKMSFFGGETVFTKK